MNNVTSLHAHAARAPQLDPENLAVAQLWQTQTLPKREALEACIEHLVTDRGLTDGAAENATIQAYAEIEGANKRHRIDLEATTTRLLVIQTPAGERVALSLVDLLALVSPEHLAARHLTFRPIGKRHRRLLMLDRQPETAPREVQA
ncbi:hypothetical protein [Halomonas elongata]|uniref:hypothetical protein n=1 Tax=Halomonas elongata TaxID=2746 RepID=UPI0023B13541|nr:hypothetical protein [Halomonas elongata]